MNGPAMIAKALGDDALEKINHVRELFLGLPPLPEDYKIHITKCRLSGISHASLREKFGQLGRRQGQRPSPRDQMRYQVNFGN